MVQLIAEFGQSHQGKLDLALQQVDATAEAGWHAYKTQLFEPDELCGPTARRYWAPSLGGQDSQADTFKDNGMLSFEDLVTVKAHCEAKGVQFLCTPFTLRAVDQLEELGVEAYKVASADITFFPLLRKLQRTGKFVLLSTGAARLSEVYRALDIFAGENVVPLACTLSYPTVDQDAHLLRLETLRKLSRVVGYSDHTLSTYTGLAAAALGASYVEKHCTISWGTHVPDDQMALQGVGQMRYYATLTQAGEDLRGRPQLMMSPSELAAQDQARRSAHAAVDLHPGEAVTPEMVIWKRPGPPDGYSFRPDEEDALYGRVLRTSVPSGLQILEADLT